MHTDRTTKALLFMIALGLWANLLKGMFTPIPTQAQGAGLAQPVRIVGSDAVLPVNVTRQALPIEVKVLPGSAAITPAR